jgi:hypothetical protein
MTAPLEEDEWSELLDFNPDRVDLVGKGANGVARFLIAKQDESAGGLLPAEMVRDLIGKQAQDEPGQSGRERVTMPNGITLSGSAAEMAAFIHKASVRQPGEPDGDVVKAKLSSAELNDLPDSAFAYIEPGGKKDASGKTTPRSLRHFAIHDKPHADNAAARIAQGAEFGEEAKPKVEAAQRRFGEKVSKDAMDPETDDGIDGLDPTVALGPDPDGDYPGSQADPGSPAWKALDASTAQKWLAIAARLKNALSVMAEREMLEAASADPSDAENAFDLEDAQCAVDYVISTLAVFAAGEQAEADLCCEADAIAKALAGFDTGALDAVEGLCAVAKSGRVLSAVNEAHLREAHARLQTVLSSLPQAPTTDDGPVNAGGTTALGEPSGQEAKPLPGDVPGRQVVKSALTLVFDRQRSLVGVTDSAAIVQSVTKADGEKKAMQAVFDQDGDLIGIVDPDAIQPVTGAGGSASPGDSDATADAAPAADDTSMDPQPPADAGTPAGAVDDDTVTKQDQNTLMLTQDVLKSIMTDAITVALGAREPAQDIAKQGDVAGLAQKVEALLADVEVLKEQPAVPKVFTNGAVPPAHQLRGQDQGAAARAVDVTKAAELKEQFLSSSSTAPQQAEAFRALEGLAQAEFARIRAAGPMGSPAAAR